jgi:Ribosomal protein L7/L12 C-terminal domain
MNPPTGQQLEEVKRAIFAGNKIEAIRLHREATGLGLRESKEAVERLETELRRTDQHQFVKGDTRRGCFSVLLICLGLTVLALAVWLR